MITGILTLPVRTIRTIADLPGRLESMERSMLEMQKLLAIAVEELAIIKGHTEVMHGQLGRIDVSTTELTGDTDGLSESIARLVAIAAPFERGVGRGLFSRRRPAANGTGTPVE
jgi:hypothetical protein